LRYLKQTVRICLEVGFVHSNQIFIGTIGRNSTFSAEYMGTVTAN